MNAAIDDANLQTTLREHLRLEFLTLRKRLTLSTIPIALAIALWLSRAVTAWKAYLPALILCVSASSTYRLCDKLLTTQSGILSKRMRWIKVLDLTTGTGWALFAVLAIPNSSGVIAWQLVAILLGVISVSISTNAASPVNFAAYVGPILITIFTTLVVRRESTFLLIAVTLYTIVLTEAYWASHRTNRRAHLERIRSDELTHRLERALHTTEHESQHDPLTGLANRRFLAKRDESSLADTTVLCIDLDHFKAVNDTHGHAVGDEMLIVVATRIAAQLRADDQVVRVGGDEFVVIAHGDQNAAEYIADRLLGALCDPYALSVGLVHAGASIGLATGTDGERLAEVQKRADLALYEAKSRGRNQVVVAGPNGMLDLTNDRTSRPSFALGATPWPEASAIPAR
jgi:diguanylate cyclase (GGDEF)-like protein